MERIPSDFLSEYYASSISDLLNNEGMILNDAEDWQRGHWSRRAEFWFVNGVEIPSLFLAGVKWQVPVKAQIEIPSINHWPARDRFEDGEILTIFDQTGEMELEIMGSAFEGKGINAKAIKNYRWDNKDVTLMLCYNLNPKFNSKYLVGIANYLSPTFTTNASESILHARNNIPILNPQPMVN